MLGAMDNLIATLIRILIFYPIPTIIIITLLIIIL
jgi:hypothetical protein